ncbi:MAG: hypothetical protein CO002_02520, partial [Candidatus Portnoybacteria bacterium CG_4_8_14_3_um_filter_44_10]
APLSGSEESLGQIEVAVLLSVKNSAYPHCFRPRRMQTGQKNFGAGVKRLPPPTELVILTYSSLSKNSRLLC